MYERNKKIERLRDCVVVRGSSPGPYRQSKWQREIRNGKRLSFIAFLDFRSLHRKRSIFYLVCAGLTCMPRMPLALARILYVELYTLAKHDHVFFVNL